MLAVLSTPGVLAQVPPPVQKSATDSESLASACARWSGRNAWGYYIGELKVGFSVVDQQLVETPAGPRFRIQDEMEIRVRRDGEELLERSVSTSWYSLEGDGPLLRIESEVLEDGVQTVMRAELKGGKMVVTTEMVGESVQRLTAPPRENMREWIGWDRWFASGPALGDKFELHATDLESAEVDVLKRAVYQGKRETVRAGIPITLHLVDWEENGIRSRAEIHEELGMVREQVAEGIERRLEPESVARSFGQEAIDIGSVVDLSVAVDMGDDGDGLEEVVLRLEGLGDLELPIDHRQRVERREDGVVLVHMVREGRSASGSPLGEDERRRFLRPEPGVECDHEKIHDLAAEITGSVRDPVAKAALLQRWVHEHLEGDLTSNSSSALVVLERGAGDCTEHALLFVALARAAGLPARRASGWMYANLGTPAYHGHAWAQVHDGHQWMGIDPSWDQVGLDAGHLCTWVEGTADRTLELLGRLKLAVERFARH